MIASLTLKGRGSRHGTLIASAFCATILRRLDGIHSEIDIVNVFDDLNLPRLKP